MKPSPKNRVYLLVYGSDIAKKEKMFGECVISELHLIMTSLVGLQKEISQIREEMYKLQNTWNITKYVAFFFSFFFA